VSAQRVACNMDQGPGQFLSSCQYWTP
jgi:hypothetical protein